MQINVILKCLLLLILKLWFDCSSNQCILCCFSVWRCLTQCPSMELLVMEMREPTWQQRASGGLRGSNDSPRTHCLRDHTDHTWPILLPSPPRAMDFESNVSLFIIPSMHTLPCGLCSWEHVKLPLAGSATSTGLSKHWSQDGEGGAFQLPSMVSGPANSGQISLKTDSLLICLPDWNWTGECLGYILFLAEFLPTLSYGISIKVLFFFPLLWRLKLLSWFFQEVREDSLWSPTLLLLRLRCPGAGFPLTLLSATSRSWLSPPGWGGGLAGCRKKMIAFQSLECCEMFAEFSFPYLKLKSLLLRKAKRENKKGF